MVLLTIQRKTWSANRKFYLYRFNESNEEDLQKHKQVLKLLTIARKTFERFQQCVLENGDALRDFEVSSGVLKAIGAYRYVNGFFGRVKLNGETNWHFWEERITGKFMKFSSNCEFGNETQLYLYNSFSHFSLFQSDSEVIVVDIQGMES